MTPPMESREQGRSLERRATRLAPHIPVDYAQIRKMVESRDGHVLDFSILPGEFPGFWSRG
jgi:hypothetical protein